MFESFLSIHAGDEDLVRPVLDHFLGELPEVITTGTELKLEDRWHRAGQTPRSRHGARFHLDRAREHLSLYLHLTRTDPVDVLPGLITEAASQHGAIFDENLRWLRDDRAARDAIGDETPTRLPDFTVPLAGDPAAAIADKVNGRAWLNGLTLDMGLLTRLEDLLAAFAAADLELSGTDLAQVLTLAAQSRSHTIDELVALAKALS